MSDLAPEHHHLMPQYENFHFFRSIAAGQQHQPAHNPDEDQIQQTDIRGVRINRRSTAVDEYWHHRHLCTGPSPAGGTTLDAVLPL
ncbi:hypothetical protein [Sphaerisporangium perillae]|uniref:hypothetical protein n=1 Tax=Sphaerisporangium perillae TaxID=2935860 RepID=UPI00200C5765|nr:hypothetical protein [Sphaerisporangium perillae]